MKAERAPAAPGPLVQGFAGRGFRVDGVTYEGAAADARRRPSPGRAPALDALAVADLAPLLALEPAPEFILLGTGGAGLPAARASSPRWRRKGIGVEAMDSRAAARTWGLLRGEGRWIAAALMPL